MPGLPDDSHLLKRHKELVEKLSQEARFARGDDSAIEPKVKELETDWGPQTDAEKELLFLGGVPKEPAALIRERILEAVQATSGLLNLADGKATVVVHGNPHTASTLVIVHTPITARHSVADMCSHGAEISDDTTAVVTVMGKNITGPLTTGGRWYPGVETHDLARARNDAEKAMRELNPTARLMYIDGIEPDNPQKTRERITTPPQAPSAARTAGAGNVGIKRPGTRNPFGQLSPRPSGTGTDK